MAARRIYKKPIKSPSNEFMRLIRMERVPAPTAKGQLQTVRKYRLHDEPMDILIIGDEVKGKKGLAVFAGTKTWVTSLHLRKRNVLSTRNMLEESHGV